MSQQTPLQRLNKAAPTLQRPKKSAPVPVKKKAVQEVEVCMIESPPDEELMTPGRFKKNLEIQEDEDHSIESSSENDEVEEIEDIEEIEEVE